MFENSPILGSVQRSFVNDLFIYNLLHTTQFFWHEFYAHIEKKKRNCLPKYIIKMESRYDTCSYVNVTGSPIP